MLSPPHFLEDIINLSRNKHTVYDEFRILAEKFFCNSASDADDSGSEIDGIIQLKSLS